LTFNTKKEAAIHKNTLEEEETVAREDDDDDESALPVVLPAAPVVEEAEFCSGLISKMVEVPKSLLVEESRRKGARITCRREDCCVSANTMLTVMATVDITEESVGMEPNHALSKVKSSS